MQLLIEGSVGPEVKNLQRALNYHLRNEPRLEVDGIFGRNTKANVIAFQRQSQLAKIDGKVGPETNKALYSFVDLRAHMAIVAQRDGVRFGVRPGFGGMKPNEFPPMPELQLPFPDPFRWPPPPPSKPRLQLDDGLLRLMGVKKFELSAGQETSLEHSLLTGKTERSFGLMTEIKATIWQRSFGKYVEMSGGTSLGVEKQIRPEPSTKVNALIFVKTEVKDILTIKPLDLAALEAEAQISKKSDEPVQFSLSVGGGPKVEVETKGGTISFGPGAFFEYQASGNEQKIGAKFKLELSYSFQTVPFL